MKNKFSKLISPIVYIYILGFLYLYGFWNTVDINIMQFLSISDVMPAIILPTILTVPSIITLGVLYGLTYYSNNTIKTISTHVNNKEKTSRLIVKSYITSIIILFITTVVCSIILMVSFGSPMVTGVVIFILFISFGIYLRDRTNFLLELPIGRGFILFMLSSLPVVMYFYGISDARKTLYGEEYFIVQMNPPCSTDENEKFRYLSTMSDKVLSISEKDGSICVSKYHSVKLIKNSYFKHFEPVKTDVL